LNRLILTHDAVGNPTLFNMTENTFNMAIELRSGDPTIASQMSRYFQVDYV